MIIAELLRNFDTILLWGFVATVVMTTILYGSQGLGFSRLSLPFLFGTIFTGNRNTATVLGFVAYMLGGWLFAFVYFAIFAALGSATWWLGTLVGFVHSLFLLVVFLPVLPYFHPRMATEYDGPTGARRLEPPGFMGLNYGRRTPLTTVLGQTGYGWALGAFFNIPG